ncbi:MAG: O-antigen ligase family protein [Desulfobacterales bacterium]
MHKASFYLLLATLISAPLAFGTVETWAYTLMELMVCASAGLLFLSARQHRLYQVPGILPLLLISGLILFQAIPLPADFVRLISPESHLIYQSAIGAVGDARWIPISVYPKATLQEFLRFSTYVLFYAAAVQFLSNAALLKRSLAVTAGFGALLAFFVIIEFFTRILSYPLPHDKILFLRDSVHGAGSVGPYVNRNHYAGFAEMLFPLALAMFLVYRPQAALSDVKKRLTDIFFQKQASRHFLYGTAAVLIATSLFVTLSRGGIISLTLSMTAFAVFLIFRTSQKRAGWGVGIVFLIVLCLTGTDAWDLIFERFGNIRNEAGEISTGRFIYWADSLEIIADFPLLGAGAGTFENIYPKYGSLSGHRVLEHAHNDYLESLATGGIMIPALMLFALAVIFRKAHQSYLRRREGYAVYLFAAALAAVFSILLHSFTDFNMQVGANGLYFFFILAIAVSAANTRFRYGLPATRLKPSGVKFFIPLTAALALGAVVFYINFGALLGNYHFSGYRHLEIPADISEDNLSQVHQAARAAAKADSLNPEYYHALAHTSAMRNQSDDALGYYQKLLRLAPLNNRYLQDAGYFLAGRGLDEKADQLMRTAIAYNRKALPPYLNYAAWLFETRKWDDGLEVLQAAMTMAPEATDTCLTLMALFGLDQNQMAQALPDRVLPHLEFADYLLSNGYYKKAEGTYLNALNYLSNEEKVKKDFFIRVYRFYKNRGSYEKALHIIQRALKQFRQDAHLHRLAGNLYKKLGITYRAEEELGKAAMMEAK